MAHMKMQKNYPHPQEIAYRVAGENWKRKTYKTEAQLGKFLNKLDDKYGLECVEIRYAD